MRVVYFSLLLLSSLVASPQSCQLSTSGCGNTTLYSIGLGNTTNTNTTYPTPFGNWYTKMRAQYIYKLSELQLAGMSAGNIGSLSFEVDSIHGATLYPEFHIRIGCTAQNTFSATPVHTDLLPGLSEVFYTPTYSVVQGNNTFIFSQPYQWDGTSNIIVEVCFEFPNQSVWTFNSVVICTNLWPDYPSLTVLTDTDTLCAGFDPGGFYSVSSDIRRPDVKLGWCLGTTSASEQKVQIATVIYPNPASDYLILGTTSPANEVRVFSVEGTLVLCKHTVTNEKLDISMLPTGIYYLQLKTPQNVSNKKFSVIK